MERLREPRHGREGRRLSEREASESNLSLASAASVVVIPSEVEKSQYFFRGLLYLGI